MASGLPLSALLSHALVAFTIEFDNEFERQMPHRTTNHGATPGAHHAPWLVSMVMWSMFMRHVPDDGVLVHELQLQLGLCAKETHVWLTRLGKWWGYVAVERTATGALVRPTAAGRAAQAVWRPLVGIIEKRWEDRFGKDKIGQLRESLWALDRKMVKQFDSELPDCLPILGYGLFSRVPMRHTLDSASNRSLPALLSKALLAFAIEFERESEVSLAISANVLRLVNDEGVRARDLPRLAAVSKEAIAMSLSFLEKRGYAVTEPESSGSRIKRLTLTAKGRHAKDLYRRLVSTIEESWQTRFGREDCIRLRQSLEELAPQHAADPYPDGWRASVPRPEGLPHYPMILHRGGFPDGS